MEHNNGDKVSIHPITPFLQGNPMALTSILIFPTLGMADAVWSCEICHGLGSIEVPVSHVDSYAAWNGELRMVPSYTTKSEVCQICHGVGRVKVSLGYLCNP